MKATLNTQKSPIFAPRNLDQPSPPTRSEHPHPPDDRLDISASHEAVRLESSVTFSEALGSGIQLALVGAGMLAGMASAQAAPEVAVIVEAPIQEVSVTEVAAPLTDPSIPVARGSQPGDRRSKRHSQRISPAQSGWHKLLSQGFS